MLKDFLLYALSSMFLRYFFCPSKKKGGMCIVAFFLLFLQAKLN